MKTKFFSSNSTISNEIKNSPQKETNLDFIKELIKKEEENLKSQVCFVLSYHLFDILTKGYYTLGPQDLPRAPKEGIAGNLFLKDLENYLSGKENLFRVTMGYNYHSFLIEKHAQQFIIYNSWQNGFNLAWWLNDETDDLKNFSKSPEELCFSNSIKDKKSIALLSELKKSYGQGKYLSISEIKNFLKNLVDLNEMENSDDNYFQIMSKGFYLKQSRTCNIECSIM